MRAPTNRRLTLRARLIVVYGLLFLIAGLVVLVLTYALVARQVPPYVVYELQTPSPGASPNAVQVGPPVDTQSLLQQSHDTLMTSLVHRGLIALLVVAVLATVLGWFIAGRALRPLHRVTGTARRIGRAGGADDALHERIALTGPRDEVKELADTFDAMLERLDESFEAQRRFVANASHELRTPLTLNRALIEVAMRRATASGDLRELGTKLLDVNARHERLINGLLVLARSRSEPVERIPTDLATLAEHVVEQARPEARAAAVEISLRATPAVTEGDPVLLERLVQNLVQNGIRHNAPGGGRVEITVGAVRAVGAIEPAGAPGRVALTVTNTGAEIPADAVAGLFEPFRRLGRDRLGGSRLEAGRGAGLGLSIVAAVAHRHGGDVHAEPRPGGGLTVRVELPGAPP